jgi:hypothetical protein
MRASRIESETRLMMRGEFGLISSSFAVLTAQMIAAATRIAVSSFGFSTPKA